MGKINFEPVTIPGVIRIVGGEERAERYARQIKKVGKSKGIKVTDIKLNKNEIVLIWGKYFSNFTNLVSIFRDPSKSNAIINNFSTEEARKLAAQSIIREVGEDLKSLPVRYLLDEYRKNGTESFNRYF